MKSRILGIKIFGRKCVIFLCDGIAMSKKITIFAVPKLRISPPNQLMLNELREK